MVHMSYVPRRCRQPKIDSVATRRRGNSTVALQELVPPPDIQERGVALRPRTWKLPVALRRWRDDEHGAEMVEFAFVVVLLIMLLYGIITYGLILAAQATVTQAAADGARAGIVATRPSTCTQSTVPSVCAADAQAGSDVGWMGKGTCPSSTIITCTAVPEPCPVERQQHLPEGDRVLQLRLVPALPRDARSRRHHPLDDLVDQRPADVEPELVDASPSPSAFSAGPTLAGTTSAARPSS